MYATTQASMARLFPAFSLMVNSTLCICFLLPLCFCFIFNDCALQQNIQYRIFDVDGSNKFTTYDKLISLNVYDYILFRKLGRAAAPVTFIHCTALLP